MTNCNIATVAKGASTEITKENYFLDKKGIENWLRSKKIISKRERLSSFSDLMPWTRLGGETYCTSFEFVTNKQTKQIVIKALVAMFPEKQLLDWSRRREILKRNGIMVSKWYYYADAAIIEELYPKTYKDVAFEKLLSIGYKLDHLGFTSLKFIDDIRADSEGNPFYIDFGFDLGDPSPKNKTSAKECLLKCYPEKRHQIISFYNQ